MTPLTITPQADREIRLEREFAAPRAVVWAALLDPQRIPDWWGRHRDETVVEEMDVRPGGRWRFASSSPDGTHVFSGVYRRLEEPSLIEQTFEWDGMPGYVSVERMTLEDLGDRTRIVVVSTFHFTEERDGMLGSGMEQGAGELYDRLDEVLEKAMAAGA
jgi:uncharacterized protein YndB with AHSA1/START domain